MLIAGGGPVGLTLALELGRRGVRCTVVEPRSSTATTRPRCKQVNTRSMEHYRRLGVAADIRAGSPLPQGDLDRAVFCTTLVGHHLHTFDDAFALSSAGSDLFPEPGQWIPQYALEETLRRALARFGSVALRTGCELEDFAQDPDGVTAVVHSAAGTAELRAEYLVGCDGSRSTVRRLLGIELEGEAAGHRNLGVTFRCPGLHQRNRLGPAVQYWTVNGEAPGLCGYLDVDDLWWAMALGVKGGEGVTEARALVHRIIGAPVPIDIVQLDPWTPLMLLAPTYRAGRAFLAGDAAHLNPPWGGWGANTGIGDAVDLGWKLAATIEGWGGPGLLDTYEQERRPVAARVIRDAERNMRVLSRELHRPGIEDDGPDADRARAEAAALIATEKRSEIYSLGLVLGQGYTSSALPADAGDPPEEAITDYQPVLRNGFRLPHVWLDDARSVFDGLGSAFTLLAPPGADVGPLASAAVSRGVPLQLATTPPHAGDHYRDELVLVRPDHYVAWHGTVAGDPQAVVDTVTGWEHSTRAHQRRW